MQETYFAYADWNRLDDFLRCGWAPSDALVDTPHGRYAVLVIWLCSCKVAYPRKAYDLYYHR